VTPRPRILVGAALVVAAAALWLGWRYAALGRAVAARERTLATSLAATPGDSARDASGRVAIAVHRNEGLFDEMLALAAARRVAGRLTLATAGASLGRGALAYRGRRVAVGEGR
jgi:hypothetical protein